MAQAQQVATSDASLAATGKAVSYNGERRLNFNENWRFQRETSGSLTGAQLPSYDDSAWRQLSLPHDWSVELDFNAQSPATHEGGFLDGGTGWYRKTFTLPSTMENKRLSIDFDGVYMNSTAYLNGQLLGTYPYGYNAFTYDVTGKAYTDGRENVLVVKVNNIQPSSRWYSGSGIYRNVYLSVTNPIHVERYGTFVTTPHLENDYKANKAGVNLSTKVKNETSAAAQIKVKSTIVDSAGTAVASVESPEQTVQAGVVANFADHTEIMNPKLWSVDNAYRYKLVTEVTVGGQVVDTYETRLGLRYFTFDPNDGFSLNGQYMKLHGVSMHHDLGALGAATNYRAVERQMQIMKDMGVNAIRVTHNPASPELIEACNNLGLLVVEEAFDAWNQSKKTYDYGRFFSTWGEHDVKEMVDNHKNEPSIIMWSLGNEIYDTTSASGVTTARNLVKWVKEIDTTRPTTIGEDKTRGDKVNVTALNANIKAIFDAVDIVGLNYSENNYAGYHQQNPNWVIYGAETSSATRSRGVYTHPNQSNQSTTYADMQQSSYDNDYVGWGRTAEDAWKRDRDLKHVAGQFIWTGFDYIGEPTPYYNSFPAKSSYFGAVDTAGFPKDIFYYYQSQWSDKPMVHLLPHWNWKTGDTVRVLAYTNAQKVELLLNGRSLGERSYESKTTSWGAAYKETSAGKTYLEWSVPYEAGTLEAVAKDASGTIIGRDQVTTAGEPAAIRLTADKQVITADGTDLSFITADIVDSAGRIVPTADNLIQFSLSGSGKLAGVDNGNAASVERYKDNKRKAFSGKALAILQSDKQAGEIVLNATAAGLTGNSVRVITVPAADRDTKTVAGFELIHVSVEVNEAPVLPAAVKVLYSDSSVATKPVTWEQVNPALYAKVGAFDVEGTVEGVTEKVKAKVIVKGAAAVKPYSTVTKVGVSPALPSKVTVLYSDDTTKEKAVIWNAIPADLIAKEGTFVIKGSVAELDLQAEASIRVTGESNSVNIMRSQAGSSYPLLEASFTNPDDKLSHINDGIKSYNDTPVNRWTNWTRTPRNDGDSITVDFGESYSINNLNLFVFTDRDTVVPQSVAVQYWNGSAWVNVDHQVSPTPYVVGQNTITFDAVRTNKLKFHMIASQTNKFVALTEVEVNADKLVMGSTAKLNEISVNGQLLSAFNPDQQSYELSLPYGSKVPELTATAGDHASVTILPAYQLPGTAKIYVTSENGLADAIYTIHMSTEKAKLVSASVTADKTNLVVDDIIDLKVSGTFEGGEVMDLTGSNPTYAFEGNHIKIMNNKLYALKDGTVKVKVTVSYENVTVTTKELTFQIAPSSVEKRMVSLNPVNIVVDKGSAPVLPLTVTANFNVGIPADVNVTWDPIDPALYNKLGEFTVLGTVQGTTLKAMAKVIVKGALSAENITLVVLKNRMPSLPKTVKVFYSDGTEEQKATAWGDIPAGSTGRVGEFDIEGTIAGTGFKAKAHIRVTDEIGSELNISRSKNGYDYPKAEASFTNRGPTSNDFIESINDDVISYEATPQNRWTNWQSTPRQGDWVSITFGDYAPQEYDVDNMEVHWFEDSGTSFPASFKIQYKSGDTWVDVTGLKSVPATPALRQANFYTFDSVKTTSLRLNMVAKPGKSLAITELKIFDKQPKANSEAKVKDILLDGKSILRDFVQTGGSYAYSVNVASTASIPQITGIGEDNTSVTVVPAVTAPGTAKVIAKSEDGKMTLVYTITYHLAQQVQQSTTLTGAEAVPAGTDFTVRFGLSGVTQYVYAQDITLNYDANVMEFVSARPLVDQMQIVRIVKEPAGKIRLIVASEGPGHAVTGTAQVAELTFRAKPLIQDAAGTISVINATLADEKGTETQAVSSSLDIRFTGVVPGVAGDINADGKVSIGDLAMIAAHYGKDSNSPDWQTIKAADVVADGVIDIEDLAWLARKLME
nr:Ig-like domain-containing protein [Paenibacillus aceris]